MSGEQGYLTVQAAAGTTVPWPGGAIGQEPMRIPDTRLVRRHLMDGSLVIAPPADVEQPRKATNRKSKES